RRDLDALHRRLEHVHLHLALHERGPAGVGPFGRVGRRTGATARHGDVSGGRQLGRGLVPVGAVGRAEKVGRQPGGQQDRRGKGTAAGSGSVATAATASVSTATARSAGAAVSAGSGEGSGIGSGAGRTGGGTTSVLGSAACSVAVPVWTGAATKKLAHCGQR